MPQAYIIHRRWISYRRYIFRFARNGYHWKHPHCITMRVFSWRRVRDSNPRYISVHSISSPQCEMEVNRKNRTLTHYIYLLRKIAEQQPFSTIITSIRTLYKTRFFKRNGGEKADNRKSNRCKKPYISRVFGVCYPMSQADFESAEKIWRYGKSGASKSR